MRFEDAVAKLEDEFGPATDEPFEPSETVIVGGGGELAKPIDEPPVLTIERDKAIEIWLGSVSAALRERKDTFKRWRFIDGPHADKWRITIQDEMCTHRIAADRYSVICTIGLAGAPDDPEAESKKD